MVATVGGLIQDPDSLDFEIAANTATTSKELVIDTTNYVLKLTRVGNLTADGVTLQCVYTKLKELWNSNSSLTPLPFPMNPMTNEQFDMINGWNFDKAINPTTKITVAACSGSSGSSTLTTTGNFNSANVFVGAYVTGSNNLGANVKVTSVDSNTSITLSTVNLDFITSASLVFYADVDYTYNLIRTSGWSVKANLNTRLTTEEWAGVISLGTLGSEGLTTTTSLSANVTNSNVITINDATTSVVGSFVFGANIPYGTKITSIISNTQFTLSKTIGTAYAGSIITIHPKDQLYYQLGTNANAAPTNAIVPGQMNQPMQIFSTGSFDYRNSANVLNVYTREQGYTYSQSSKTDIGFANLTYQTYRFPIVSLADEVISVSDSTISSTGITPTASPWNNMRLTWYATPQARVINNTTYYFNVIIDANIAATTTYSTATIQQIYEYVQWTLRRPVGIDIDSGSATKTGVTTRALVKYEGDILQTIYDAADGGVYIDHFALADINNLHFTDNTRIQRVFNFVAEGDLAFNSYLAADGANTTYELFFKQINQGNVISAGYTVQGSLTFGTRNAQLVQGFGYDPSGDGSYEVKGNLQGGVTSVNYDMLWENNQQARWLPNNYYYVNDEYSVYTGTAWAWYRVTSNYVSGATWGANSDSSYATVILGPTVYLVTQGRTNAQYFLSLATTLQKSTTNNITASPNQEKNYSS